ncbi:MULTISPECIES: DUF1073 domain-containing protein [unclassified Beijerinckia]|uniref:DUF1073 domain-containing protein n=1 Tax=unclassified Beijerinckia TaxID=2638183 RepID=UPI00089BA9B3|nr:MULTISPECIES: DUF1073 domain-containing protein [unclassified Beijerinckia]MDH7794108.1 phage-related protein (TIGR01555 family) [Beijerinckia sp. GAS462]SEB53487.1 hypothetical protein SAMN05443249_0374 [Beijerinckia sp. 28-YEA-48]
MLLFDRLSNLVTGLGTGKDKSTAQAFSLKLLGRDELDAMYRCDWLSRKIVDIVAFDATREWRLWQAAQSEIDRIEREEQRLNLREKCTRALQLARLYGGAAVYLGTRDGDVAAPLDVERLGLGGLTYLHVLTPFQVRCGEIDRDPLSAHFGEPLYYELADGRGQAVRVHPSRMVRFVGAPHPEPMSSLSAAGAQGWGDPVLQIVYDAVCNAASSQQHVAALLPELKIDIVSVPNLQNTLATEEGTNRLAARFFNANLLKSLHSVLLLQGGDEAVAEQWQQRQIDFTQFPELLRQFLQVAAGAADIPVTRLVGQAPAGLNATGDGDIRNYYDRIAAHQRVDLAPRLERIDQCLIRSALGSRPSGIYYEFTPLWQLSAVEKADIALKLSQAVTALKESGLVPTEVLALGLRNRLIEDGMFPGIEAAYGNAAVGRN